MCEVWRRESESLAFEQIASSNADVPIFRYSRTVVLQRRRRERPDLVGHLSIGRPSSIENVRDAVTAGVLLEFEGHYVFQAGLNGPGDALGIVRLGGHLESGETAEECARREVREEGNADASLVAADSTWSYEPDGDSFKLTAYEGETSYPAPLLVTAMAPDRGVSRSRPNPGVSITYRAVAKSRPTPGAECSPTRSMNMAATRCVETRSGRGEASARVRVHGVGVGHSAVVSVTATRAEDSSTMAFLAA